MADLTTAVGELLKKKNTEENLHIYVEGLSSLYKRMAELRLAMNYYTFAEIYSDFDFAKKQQLTLILMKSNRLLMM